MNRKTRKKPLTLVHQNIQGYTGKQLEIELFLEKFNVDILCLTEHRRRDEQKLELGFKNYEVASSYYRKYTASGGSAIIVKSSLVGQMLKTRSQVIEKMSREEAIELSCVELRNDIIICVSLPRDASSDLYSQLKPVMWDVLCTAKDSGKFITVCGDCDIIELRISGLFQQLTMMTVSSVPCNVFSNYCYLEDISFITCFGCEQSGQMLTLGATQDEGKGTKSEDSSSDVVDGSTATENLSKHLRRSVEKEMFLEDNTLKKMLDDLLSGITKEFAYYMRHEEDLNGSRNGVHFCVWANEGVRILRDEYYQLCEAKHSSPDDASVAEKTKKHYEKYRVSYNAARSRYIEDQSGSYHQTLKSVLTVFKHETGNSNPLDLHNDLKNHKFYQNSQEAVAIAFHNIFDETIPNVQSSKLDSSLKAQVFLQHDIKARDAEFGLKVIDEEKIIEAVESLQPNATDNLWNAAIDFIKFNIHNLAPKLTRIFNRTITSGWYPRLIQRNDIITLLKSDTTAGCGELTLVHVLHLLNVLLEKLILDQLVSYFDSNRLLNKQFRYAKGWSAADSECLLVMQIYRALEEDKKMLALFCDFKKSFHRVDHEVLLLKLSHYGVKGRELELFRNLLANTIRIGQSEPERKTGLPQLSILSPFLFLVYVNDLLNVTRTMSNIQLLPVKSGQLTLLFEINSKDEDCILCIKRCIKHTLHWFIANNLELNNENTKSIKFFPPNVKDFSSKFDGKIIPVKEAVFSNVTIDSNLGWSSHTKVVEDKLKQALEEFKLIQKQVINYKFLDSLIYSSLFKPLLSHGILLWGHTTGIQTIFNLQKEAIRAVYGCGDSPSELFRNNNILTVPALYVYENIMFVRKYAQSFQKLDENPTDTSSTNELHVPKYRLDNVKSSFLGKCVRFYNKIPEDIKTLSQEKIIERIRSDLVDGAYESVGEYLQDTNAFRPRRSPVNEDRRDVTPTPASTGSGQTRDNVPDTRNNEPSIREPLVNPQNHNPVGTSGVTAATGPRQPLFSFYPVPRYNEPSIREPVVSPQYQGNAGSSGNNAHQGVDQPSLGNPTILNRNRYLNFGVDLDDSDSDDDEELTCKQCDRTFETKPGYLSHMRAHERREMQEHVEPMPKNNCNTSFGSSTSRDEELKCSECYRTFETKPGYLSHMRAHERQEMQEPKPKNNYNNSPRASTSRDEEFKCPECYRTFETKPGYLSHMRAHERQEMQEPKPKNNYNNYSPRASTSRDEEFKCPECYRTFETKSGYLSHMRAHERQQMQERVQPMQKNNYNNTSSGYSSYDSPRRASTSREYNYDNGGLSCPECYQSFSSKPGYLSHMRAHARRR